MNVRPGGQLKPARALFMAGFRGPARIFHGADRDEIRRDVGRRHRAHPQRGAAAVKREVDSGHEVAVVVSAMSGVTNQLVGWVDQVAPLHDAREYDAVVATGEQVTSGPDRARAAGDSESTRAPGWAGNLPMVSDAAHGKARDQVGRHRRARARFAERPGRGGGGLPGLGARQTA
jgi:aspartate kinase